MVVSKESFVHDTLSRRQAGTSTTTVDEWSLSLDSEQEESPRSMIPQSWKDAYDTDGFFVLPTPALSRNSIHSLNQRLEETLRGRYTTGTPPDKQPRKLKSEYRGSKYEAKHPVGPLGFSGNTQNVKVLQVINIRKADPLFGQVATHRALGQLVSRLAGWRDGARLAQDQVWAKPPGAAPLAFHRDAPYFMFDPPHVVTVWIALDDMDRELGPLQYIRQSHRWEDGQCGIAGQFFQENGGLGLLQTPSMMKGGGKEEQPLDIVVLDGLPAGSLAIHHGRTWHGSDKNKSPVRPRRGLGLHFVPANVRFTADAQFSKLWKPFVAEALANGDEVSQVPVPEDEFPIVWQPPETTKLHF